MDFSLTALALRLVDRVRMSIAHPRTAALAPSYRSPVLFKQLWKVSYSQISPPCLKLLPKTCAL